MEKSDLLCLIEAATNDDTAWERLWSVVEPRLWDLVDRPRFASHVAHTERARRDIVAQVRAAIGPRQLRRFLDTRRLNPRLGFERWLRTLAKRIGWSRVRPPSYGRQLQT